jgi:hypothetical protein
VVTADEKRWSDQFWNRNFKAPGSGGDALSETRSLSAGPILIQTIENGSDENAISLGSNPGTEVETDGLLRPEQSENSIVTLNEPNAGRSPSFESSSAMEQIKSSGQSNGNRRTTDSGLGNDQKTITPLGSVFELYRRLDRVMTALELGELDFKVARVICNAASKQIDIISLLFKLEELRRKGDLLRAIPMLESVPQESGIE